MIKSLPIKHHSLTGRISVTLMYDAFRAIRHNKGKSGTEGVSIEKFARHLEQNLAALMRNLKQGTYQSRPVRRVMIPQGGSRAASEYPDRA